MSEEKHILTKLETIYFGKKENKKLTMHEIGVVLDYVALLEQNNRYINELEKSWKEEIIRLNNFIQEDSSMIEMNNIRRMLIQAREKDLYKLKEVMNNE